MKPTSVIIGLACADCKPVFNSITNQYELISNTNIVVYPHTQVLVDTGCKIVTAEPYNMLISNIEIQAYNGINLALGTHILNTNIEGTIKLMLRNTGNSTYRIKSGITKVAQFTFITTCNNLVVGDL